MSADHVDAVRSSFDGWNRGDVDAWLEHVHPVRDLGDTVVALGLMHTRGKVSGVDLEQPVGYVFEFERGLARKVRAYLEHRAALRAAGLGE